MVFTSSLVSSGHGLCLVTSIGLLTGQILALPSVLCSLYFTLLYSTLLHYFYDLPARPVLDLITIFSITPITEFGKTFQEMKDIEQRKSPLQVKMDELGKKLSIVSFAIIACIMAIGIFQGKSFLSMFNIGMKSNSLILDLI